MLTDDKLIDNPSAQEAKRLSIIKRYSGAANHLPIWAQDALRIKMGSVEVTAKDSFELFLIRSKGFLPKYDYVNFQKRFVEIFQYRAENVLKKLIDSRAQNKEFFVSSDYFWQEFLELFVLKDKPETQMDIFIEKTKQSLWDLWNKALTRGYKALVEILKVGLSGRSKWFRWLLKFKSEGEEKESVS